MQEAGGGQIRDKPSPLPAPQAGTRARWQSLLDPTLPTLQALGSWAMGRCAPKGRRLRIRSQLRDKPASLTFMVQRLAAHLPCTRGCHRCSRSSDLHRYDLRPPRSTFKEGGSH